MSTGNLPPWDPSNFYFDLPGSIPRCSNATWDYESIESSNPQPKAPYHAVFYAGGYEPYRIQFNNTNLTGKLGWIANLPVDIAFGVSMFDVENYTSGMLERTVSMTPRAGCNLANPLKPSTLDVEVTGESGQCQMSWVNIKNGTPPYQLEIAPIGRHQKTIHFMTSPLGFVLDMSTGLDYWLAVYDSAGHSAVMGSYKVSVTSETACLEAASTVTAGRFSTMYPGGTTTFATSTAATATSTSSLSNTGQLKRPAIIAIAVAVPVAVIFVVALLIWFCYERHRRRNDSEEKAEIEPSYAYPDAQYANRAGTPVTGSLRDASSGYYSPPLATPYSPPPTSTGNRSTIYTTGDAPTAERSSMILSEKRRHLINPDAHSSGPINAEPFDPELLSGPSKTQSEPAPSPPAYSASS
ncbi:Transmembrane alpha-helix domain [Rhizoctonia solani]|uniref:Transmembrane alpha-helix domain n=1 Tax=Rhizoctonia solani TaxID=456999 RepID=A0A8H8SW71_9AGAM|nr:Transmembrane alpha-helix domain [Rhizoctonia solani]QRW20244.1 Transmembrane alpha-helix domain [Rhizoctonia solani]